MAPKGKGKAKAAPLSSCDRRAWVGDEACATSTDISSSPDSQGDRRAEEGAGEGQGAGGLGTSRSPTRRSSAGSSGRTRARPRPCRRSTGLRGTNRMVREEVCGGPWGPQKHHGEARRGDLPPAQAGERGAERQGLRRQGRRALPPPTVGFVEEGAATRRRSRARGRRRRADRRAAALKAPSLREALSPPKVEGAKGGVVPPRRRLRRGGDEDGSLRRLRTVAASSPRAAGAQGAEAVLPTRSRPEREAAAQKLRDLRDLSKQNNSKRDAATAGEKDAIKAEIAAERFEWERQRDPTNFK